MSSGSAVPMNLQERDVEVVELPIAVLGEVLKPLEVDVAAHVVAESETAVGSSRKRFCGRRERGPRSLHIGALSIEYLTLRPFE
jgi:hypothetical protein